MQHIPLSQGQFAIVDDEDAALVAEFKWCYRAERNGQSGYAVRHHKVDGRDRLLYLHALSKSSFLRAFCGSKVRRIFENAGPLQQSAQRISTKQYLHRQLMNPPEGYEVVFLNFDKLDCRKANLRVVTKEEARRHHRVRKDSKSGVKGVRHNPGNDSWSAYVYRNDRCHHVGTFYSQEQAVAAYEEALRHENPGLSTAPERVERPAVEGCTKRKQRKKSASIGLAG